MRILFITTVAVVCAVLFSSCTLPGGELARAREMVASGEAQCVLLVSGKIAVTKTGGGVSPLLEVYDQYKPLMQDAVLADKVIGRAAAFIAIAGGVRSVHAGVMSEDARDLLRQHGADAYCDILVPRILNRNKSDLCPMEKAVAGITDPEEAVDILTAAVEKLKK